MADRDCGYDAVTLTGDEVGALVAHVVRLQRVADRVPELARRMHEMALTIEALELACEGKRRGVRGLLRQIDRLRAERSATAQRYARLQSENAWLQGEQESWLGQADVLDRRVGELEALLRQVCQRCPELVELVELLEDGTITPETAREVVA